MSSSLALIKQTLKHEEHTIYNNLFGKPHTFSDFRGTIFRCPHCAGRVVPETHPTFKKLCDTCPKGKLPSPRTFTDPSSSGALANKKPRPGKTFVFQASVGNKQPAFAYFCVVTCQQCPGHGVDGIDGGQRGGGGQ